VSRPRFLADNDVKDAIVRGARRREPSLEIVRLRELDLHEQPDDEVLASAASLGFLLLSHDVNTMWAAALHRVTSKLPMSGLCLAAQRGTIRPIIEDLILIWTASELEEWQGRIVYLPL
jgi:hypothetical protein